MHRLVALLAAWVHVVFVAFTVLGGFLALLVPWVLLPHVASALWGARMARLRTTCPLSAAENWGRTGSGRPRLRDGGFIAHYAEGRLYPRTWARRVEIGAGTLVLGSWVVLAMR